jgi:hypothetical protein
VFKELDKETLAIRSMNNNPPIKFLWGTFCRRAIVDRETQETSIIDIMPGLKLEIAKPAQNTDHASLLLNLNKMAVVALFNKLDGSDSQVDEILNVEISTPGSETQTFSIPIIINHDKNNTFVNIILDPATLLITPTEQIDPNYIFEVNYKLQNQHLGKVSLPVEVKYLAN